jgi:pimeloyl-ACP methyl ester carboxylesterase
LRPAIDALARQFSVFTFPLAGERASGAPFDPRRTFDNYADQVAAAMDAAGAVRAPVCGISFGGLGALRFAATRPDRTSALVLVSTPGPRWGLRRRHEFYLRHPYLFGPLFLAESPLRLRPEIAAAFPRRRDRAAFARGQLAALMSAPLSLRRMAERGEMLKALDTTSDCARISAPTLIVTGDASLDYVVPAEGTSRYAALIPRARSVIIGRTGHLGCNTRPEEFARIVGDFVAGAEREHAA